MFKRLRRWLLVRKVTRLAKEAETLHTLVCPNAHMPVGQCVKRACRRSIVTVDDARDRLAALLEE